MYHGQSFFFFFIIKKVLLKKRKKLLSTQEVYTGTVKAAHKKKNEPKTNLQKPSNLYPQEQIPATAKPKTKKSH
jgi:hypothetical protein